MSGWASTRSTPRGPMQREAQHGDARQRQQPPRRHARADERGGEGQRERHDDRDEGVVADHEVIQELRQCTKASHHAVGTGAERRKRRACRLRKALTSASEAASMNAMRARIATSPPGHRAPAPSAPQKMPNEVSITPTAYLSVFSGTRLSGARTAIPTAATTTTAAAAARAASATLCWFEPKVTAMNATSRPSSSTPLNDSMNP